MGNKLSSFILQLYFAASMGLFAVLFVPQDTITTTTGSNLSYMLTWVLLYLCTLIILIRRKFEIYYSEIFILMIPSFHLISTIWSPQPEKSLIYSICFIANSLFVIALKRNFNLHELVLKVINIIFIMSVLGFFFYILGFENVVYFDIHQRENLFGGAPIRGFFNHKITAGLYTAIAFNLAYIFLSSRKRTLFMSVFFVFNLMTGSATGLSLLFIGFLIISLFNVCKRNNVSSNSLIIVTFIILTLSVFLFSQYGADALILLGRDPTLTGRTLLWAWGIETGLEMPVLGWGYLGYLGTSFAGNVAETYTEFQNYDVPHFHNSLIQIFVDGGILYTIFIISLILISLKMWYGEYLKYETEVPLAFSFLSLFLLIASVFVYIYSRYNDFSTIIFMLIVATIPRKKINN